MTTITGFHTAIVEKRIDWTPTLFSLGVRGPELSFKAGQFTKLALPDKTGRPVSRAYSVVNAPEASGGNEYLEFLIVEIPDGKLTPSLKKLEPGDEVLVGQSAHGDLTMEAVPDFTRDLWLLSTGTGIGPFLSLLSDRHHPIPLETIVLVHGVRHQTDLVYRDEIEQLRRHYGERLHYVPIVSRDRNPPTLSGRIPQRLADNSLFDRVGLDMDNRRSFAMLCGSPDMIKETGKTLEAQGLSRFRQATGGNFVHERYW